MKRQIAKLVMAFFLVSILAGCSAPKSTVTSIELSEREKQIAALSSDGVAGVMEFDYTGEVRGALYYIEVREKEDCLKRERIIYGGASGEQALYLLMEIDADSGLCQWHMRKANENATAKLRTFEQTIPLDEENGWGCSWSFLGGRYNQPVELVPGETYTLAEQTFDVSVGRDGVHGDSDYSILLLMDTFATEEEALAAADRMEEEMLADAG